jgi:hypothetical protein
MKVVRLLKYNIVDKEKIKVELDQIKQDSKQKVQAYPDKTKKLFIRGNLELQCRRNYNV